MGAYTIADLPGTTAALRCGACGRGEVYRKEDLIAAYGADAPVAQILKPLADCPRWGQKRNPCRASITAPMGS
jgi:hypothetical protein